MYQWDLGMEREKERGSALRMLPKFKEEYIKLIQRGKMKVKASAMEPI